ncbi:MAG: NUDIX domain-containing protein [Candidatus Micrarchaeota archaeon]|nr:NUDIX domain-containing protein [Candidatus Micrarchaeota archaeon]
MKEYPEIVVNGLILNEKDDILLVKNEKWDGLLSLPGGHVEIGETLKSALQREIEIQLGISVHIGNMLKMQEFLLPPGYYLRKHYIVFNFVCKTDEINIILKHKNITDYIWVDPESAQKMNIDPYTLSTIKEYLKKKSGKIDVDKDDIKIKL